MKKIFNVFMLGLCCQTVSFGMEAESIPLTQRHYESPKTMEELGTNKLFRLACDIEKSESCIAGNEHWMPWWVHTKQYGNGRSGPCARLFVNAHDKIVVVCFEGTGSKEEVDLQANDPKKFGNVKAHSGIMDLTYEVTSPFVGNMEEEKRKHFQNGFIPNKKLASWIKYYEKYQYNFLVMGYSVGGAQALLYYMKLVEGSIIANDSGHICVAFAPSGCVIQKSVNVYNNQFPYAYTVFNPNDPVSYFGHYYAPNQRYYAPGIPVILGEFDNRKGLNLPAHNDFSLLTTAIEKNDFTDITIGDALSINPRLEAQSLEILVKSFSHHHLKFLSEYRLVTIGYVDGFPRYKHEMLMFNKFSNLCLMSRYVNEIVTTQPLSKISEKSVKKILGEEGANSWNAILENVPEDFKTQKNHIHPSQIGHQVSYIATGLNVVRALGISALTLGLYYLVPSLYASYVGESL